MKMKNLHPSKLGFTHYGIADNAVELLNKYEIVYRKWVEIVKKGFEENLDINEIYKIVKNTDINVNLQEKFFKSRGYGEEEVLFSLYGIYSYFLWKKDKIQGG